MAAVAAEFRITPAGTRMALNRMVARGVLQAERIGRQTGFRAPPHLRPLLDEAVLRIFEFGRSARPWGGTWTMVAFSLPEEQRSVRNMLRTRLRWLGFAPLYDGLWVCPHERADRAAALLGELGVATATVLTGRVPPTSPAGGDPIRAWDLAELRNTYEGFLSRFARDRARVLAGQVSAAEALVIRTELMDRWRLFSNADPDLPAELLPADWPLPAAVRLFSDIYDGLAELAAGRFAELVSSVDPSLADQVRYRTTSAPGLVGRCPRSR